MSEKAKLIEKIVALGVSDLTEVNDFLEYLEASFEKIEKAVSGKGSEDEDEESNVQHLDKISRVDVAIIGSKKSNPDEIGEEGVHIIMLERLIRMSPDRVIHAIKDAYEINKKDEDKQAAIRIPVYECENGLMVHMPSSGGEHVDPLGLMMFLLFFNEHKVVLDCKPANQHVEWLVNESCAKCMNFMANIRQDGIVVYRDNEEILEAIKPFKIVA